METPKGKSIVCALPELSHVAFTQKRVLHCRRRLTFDDDDEASTSKRKSIPFVVDATKAAKNTKRIKLDVECERSKESREDHIFQPPKQVPVLAMAAGSEVKGDKKLPLLDKEGGSSIKRRGISGKYETNVVLEPGTPFPLGEKKPLSRKRSVAMIRTNQSTENKLRHVEKIVSEAWYYTRSLNKLVLDQIEQLECQDTHNQHQLKVHSVRVSLKGSKKGHPRCREVNQVLREWRKLLRKNDAQNTVERFDDINQPLRLQTKAISFIHKVGSIQGSKEYFPWKGSVLDSVIGVFLAQRVSDHLSSSAFMLLGASFPQIQNCGGYGRHHRILREKRPNAGSPKTPSFGLVSKRSETMGDGADLEKHTRILSKGKRGQEISRKVKVGRRGNPILDWSSLREKYIREEESETRSIDALDSVDWDAVSRADVVGISKAISSRGMNIKLAMRIKDFLTRLLVDHGNLDLEWMRNVPPQKAKKFLLSVAGLGLKSGECLRLLTLRQCAFPVDINVARVTVRLGWVPAPPIGDKHLMSLLQDYSGVHDLMHEYLWPRLCKLDQNTLYQLHYQMITFGKVFCTNQEPRCDECPMRTECKYFSNIIQRKTCTQRLSCMDKTRQYSGPICQSKKWKSSNFEMDIEDFGSMDQPGNDKTLAEELAIARLKLRYLKNQCLVKDTEGFSLMESVEAPHTPKKYQSIFILRPPKMSEKKPISRKGRVSTRSGAKTQHSVFELPDWHPILETFDDRDPDDSMPYLLVTWESGQFDCQKPVEALVKDESSFSH